MQQNAAKCSEMQRNAAKYSEMPQNAAMKSHFFHSFFEASQVLSHKHYSNKPIIKQLKSINFHFTQMQMIHKHLIILNSVICTLDFEVASTIICANKAIIKQLKSINFHFTQM